MLQVLDTSGRTTRVALASLHSSGFLEDAPTGGGVELVAGPDGMRRHRSYSAVYRTNPWLWACVNLLARSMSRFPMKVYRVDDNGDQERVRHGSANRAETLARVLRRPGYGRSAKTLIHATAVDRFVNGNGIWWPDRDRVGNYVGIRRIPWKYSAHEEIGGVLRYWDTRKPGVKRLADDVVHFGADLDCDELDNPSPILALHKTIALYDAVERHLVAYFRNSARPSGHLEIDKGTGPIAQSIIRAELEKLYTSPENAGKVMVTSGKWTQITESPDSMKVIELAKQTREEICATFGIPPPLVGILDRAIMSNVKELRSHLARDVAGTHTGLFEGDIDAQLIARDSALGDIEMEFEMAATLRPDLEARAATWKAQRYVRSLNEIRKTEGLPPIPHPWADLPWMPLNERPIGEDDSPDEVDEGKGGTEDEDAFRRQEDDEEDS